MLRVAIMTALGMSVLGGCGHSNYAVRPLPRIAADNVGKPVSRLRDAFGAPRKIDASSTKLVYVWFLEEVPPGAPQGFHGCEMEVTVDIRSEHVLGFSLANVGWGKCREMERKIRVAES
jgi:hypothetical protein